MLSIVVNDLDAWWWESMSRKTEAWELDHQCLREAWVLGGSVVWMLLLRGCLLELSRVRCSCDTAASAPVWCTTVKCARATECTSLCCESEHCWQGPGPGQFFLSLTVSVLSPCGSPCSWCAIRDLVCGVLYKLLSWWGSATIAVPFQMTAHIAVYVQDWFSHWHATTMSVVIFSAHGGCAAG